MTAELVAPLTETEAAELAECEETIERDLGAFRRVGERLIMIRDQRLYRGAYGTFEAYLQERWGLARKRGYELMSAAATAKEVEAVLSEISDNIPIPANEGQAKQLRGLEPGVAAEVMTEAAESGKVTAASIRDARERIAPRPEPEPSPGESAQKLSDYLDADPDLRRREQARKFRQDLNRSWALQDWEPEFVAAIVDDDDVVTITHLIQNLTSFRDQVQAARHTPLAVVKEMRR